MTRFYRANGCDDPTCTDERCQGGEWVEDEGASRRLANHAYLVEVLTLFHEDTDELWPPEQADHNGCLHFAVNCNDLFHWATADSESIGESDLPLLRQCFADVTRQRSYLAASLFCARKRGMRPQGAFFTKTLKREAPEIIELFAAAGPPRDDVGLWNPVGRPDDQAVESQPTGADTIDQTRQEPT